MMKFGDKTQREDVGEAEKLFPSQWDAMFNKGHQDVLQFIRSVLSQKKVNGIIPWTDKRLRNGLIAPNHVILGNYFGRLTTLWSILDQRLTFAENWYDKVIMVCRCLTNFQIT